jgi:hypothetical protein
VRRLTGGDLRFAVSNLLVDRTTSRVSEAFDAADIPHILLKGPSIGDWLYSRDEVRPYHDSDFLVAHADWERAIDVLQELGFRDRLAAMGHPRMESLHSYPWRHDHPEYADIDLHATLDGLNADSHEVWATLSVGTVALRVARRDVTVLSPAGRALHIALHAAQHRQGHPLEDLGRALEQLSAPTWARAAQLAARLDGTAAFASGLCTLSAGEKLARRLGVAGVSSTETSLRAAEVPLAEGLHALLSAPSLRARLGLLRREVFPSPAFLRWWTPLARSGALGLLAAYAWRPCYLLLRLPRAALALRAALRG